MERRTMLVSLLILATFAFFDGVQSNSGGPPMNAANFNRICVQMEPSHGATPQTGNGGYVIGTNLPLTGGSYRYTAGQTYRVTLTGTITFRGFLVIAHVPGQNQMLIGQFMPQGNNQQTIDCDATGTSDEATITHSNSGITDFNTMEFMWEAPSEGDGTVNFRYTVVQIFNTYYVALDAALINSQPTAPVRAPEDYRLTFRTPDNCTLSNCTSFVGIDTNTANSAFLDIYLEGEAMGWVAVGFSETRSMFSADVVGCYRDPTDESVGVLDTYNVAPPGRNNMADASQDIVLFNRSFIDGRIICTVAKEIAPTDPAPQDLDLNAFLYIFWGRRSDAESAPITQLNGHDSGPGVNPEISQSLFNPSTGAMFTATVKAPEDYQLTFRTPDGCTLSNCTSFVGIDINNASDAFLDIYMEGEALGWVAVGFSETRDMFSADVVGCNRDPATNMVEVLDTNNVPSSTRGNNVDASQDVVLFNSSFDGTRIYCTVAKRIAIRDESPKDIDLNSNVYVMWGVRPDDSMQGQLLSHAFQQPCDIPAISQARFNLVTGDIMIQLQQPVIAALDYRLRFLSPSGCDPSSCDIFVGVQTNAGNPNFLDIYIEGTSEGWVAVGFSETRDMFAADVVGCSREASTDIVAVVDTWNNAGARFNEFDSEQNVVLFNSSFSNGRISCSVAKQIAPAGTDEDLDLNADLYVMYGVGPGRSGASALGLHVTGPGGNPALSRRTFNLLTGDMFLLQPPVRAPEDYQLTFRTPDNCTLSNCTSFVGIDINTASDAFLDIYMEGEALGWVAVGFSETRDMFSADVVACNRDPATNMVEVLDTYNVPSPDRGNNVDASQDVVLFNSSFDGTRIYCTTHLTVSVAKRIALRDESPRDIDLSSNVYVMWGVRPDDSMQGELLPHASQQPSDIPAISQARFNLITGAVENVIQLQPPVIAALDYRLRFVDPPGCDPSSCDIFVGIQTNAGNPNFLDIYIEGSSDGWVAVGFSDSRDMLAADVVGCSREASTDIVAVVDTWNNAGGRFNELDSEQNVVLFNSSFSNGRISCSVAKQIAPAGTDDLDLNTTLYVMYGVASGRSGASALGAHATGGGNPSLSQERFNPAVDSAEVGEDFPTAALLRAHGIIMLIAWPLLAVSGIFFAAWMRPALPNGEWFQIHRAFLLASLFVGALGFILAFVAHAENPTPGLINLGSDDSVGTAHYAIGIIVMLFHIINPLIAIIRCNPGDKKRWIFNLIHGTTIGLLVELFALINIALGLYQFASTSFFEDRTIFWVYIGYFIFLLALIGVLFVIFTLLSLFSQDEDRAKTAPSMIKPLIKAPSGKQSPGEGVEMAVPGQKPSAQDDGPPKPKLPSKDAPLRWGALTVFLVVNIVMMLVLIILIAIE